MYDELRASLEQFISDIEVKFKKYEADMHAIARLNPDLKEDTEKRIAAAREALDYMRKEFEAI